MNYGWGPGRQETAVFNILEAYFRSAFGFTKRITDIEAPDWRAGGPGTWKITFVDGSTAEVYP